MRKLLFALVCLGSLASAQASLLKFVWAESQPPTVDTSTQLKFHDPVFNTDVSITALNGGLILAHAFDPSFPSLPSPLGPLGPGKEDFTLSFTGPPSQSKLLIDANVPVINAAGDIINAVVSNGAERMSSQSRSPDSVTFTEELDRTGVLDFSLTNFLFTAVPEPSTYLMAAMPIVAALLFLRRRLLA